MCTVVSGYNVDWPALQAYEVWIHILHRNWHFFIGPVLAELFTLLIVLDNLNIFLLDNLYKLHSARSTLRSDGRGGDQVINQNFDNKQSKCIAINVNTY